MAGQNTRRNWLPRVLYLAVAALMLINAGCLALAAGAAAAGGAAGYAYYKGKVCQAYTASFNDTWAATQTALRELNLPIIQRETDSPSTGTIISRTADDSGVTIDLETGPSSIPAEGMVTRVCVRVGTFGDEAVSERVLAQIAAHLTPTHFVPGGATTRIRPTPAWNPSSDGAPGEVRPASHTQPAETEEPPSELPEEPTPPGKP